MTGVWYWPLIILTVCVVGIVLLITAARMHPFFALLATAIAAGLLAVKLPGEPGYPHWAQAVVLSLKEFGVTARNIGFVIAMASVIGVCLLESGGAEKIVRRLLAWLGEARAGVVLLASGFLLGIPVFFDTVFFLLIPLARALSLRSPANYLFYVLVICGGGVITHSIVAPTPGPLMMADILRIDLGVSILAGVAAGLLPAAGVLLLARWLNFRLGFRLPTGEGEGSSDANSIIRQPESNLPSLTQSVMPVLLPVVCIAAASFYKLGETYFPLLGAEGFSLVKKAVEWFGNRNVAMGMGAVLAMGVLVRRRGTGCLAPGFLLSPMKTAVLIILITSAGGAFGAMIRHAGVGDAIKVGLEGREMNFVILGWFISSVLKLAQGSGTVAMITTSGMMAAIMQGEGALPYHPIYVFLAIGYGSMTLSWMNDSAFWVVGKLSGFTVGQTLRSWTVLLACISVAGLLQVWVLSVVLPLR